MTTTASSRNLSPQDGVAGASQEAGQVRLDEVVREALRDRIGGLGAHQLVARCEDLPEVTASRVALRDLFGHLLDSILCPVRTDKRYFLHVDCRERPAPQGAEALRGGQVWYDLLLQANVCSNTQWQLAQQDRIEASRSILAGLGGKLTVNEVAQAGCLYIITLPGKQF